MVRFLSVFFILALSITPSFSAESGGNASSLPRGAELIGVASSDSKDYISDQRFKMELDSLVSRIRHLSDDITVLIEAFYPGKLSKSSEEQIKNSFALAEHVEQYLRSRHKLNYKFVVTVMKDDDVDGKLPKIRLTTYPRDFFEN